MSGEVDRLLAIEPPAILAGADDGIRAIALGLSGRLDEARRKLIEMRQASRIPLFQSWIDYLLAWVDRRTADMNLRPIVGTALKIQDDPEAIFQEGWLLCDVGRHEEGLSFLQRAIAKGYFVVPTLSSRSQFDALREPPRVHCTPRGRRGGAGSCAGGVPQGGWRTTARLMKLGSAASSQHTDPSI